MPQMSLLPGNRNQWNEETHCRGKDHPQFQPPVELWLKSRNKSVSGKRSSGPLACPPWEAVSIRQA